MCTGWEPLRLAGMTAPPEMFNVHVTFDAPEGDRVVRRLIDALNEHRPELAKGIGVSYSDGYATMEFEPVPADPTAGPASADAPIPGAEIVAALEGFSHQRSLVVPVVRAVLTADAAREAAGLTPRREMRIDVVPAPKLHQDVLSSHRSGAAPRPDPRFGAPEPAASTTARRD